jgi:vancomycin permeability regulator SanA
MSPAPAVFVIFGAAVWEDGRASNAMRRRVEGALISAQGLPDALFLVSGGVGKQPPSEAAVMSKLLQDAGVLAGNILLDEASTDTLDSIRNCAEIVKSLPTIRDVVVCSDVYHIPRCRWLFKLFSIPTRSGKVASGRFQNTASRWLYYHLPECAALPWDTFSALIDLRG